MMPPRCSRWEVVSFCHLGRTGGLTYGVDVRIDGAIGVDAEEAFNSARHLC